MKKPEFIYLLLGVSYATFKITERIRGINMPSNFKYNVYLNKNFDEDNKTLLASFYEKKEVFYDLDDKEVAELICKNEEIPIWIDISVEKVSEGYTVFQLLCSERFSDKINEFYYNDRGSGPFGIKVSTD